MKKIGDVEFISYDGAYPNLCSGTLVLKIKDQTVSWNHCLISGGCAGVDYNLNEFIENGEWSVRVPDEFKKYENEITILVNKNISQGCCGGCI